MHSLDPANLEIRDLHNLMIGGVAPRPIALVSTQSEDGKDNLAPFSFFNAFSSNPPVVAFSPARRGRDGSYKDTYNNLMATKECVVHIVTYNMVEQSNLASTEFETGVDEFTKSGFTKLPAEKVRASRVKESPLHMECKLRDMIALGNNNGAGNLAICDVVQFHIDENVYIDQKVVIEHMHQVGRNGGAYYTKCDEQSLFEVPQPRTEIGIGWDQLPAWVFEIGFTKNELAQLALIEALPKNAGSASPSKGHIQAARTYLAQRQTEKAWESLLDK